MDPTHLNPGLQLASHLNTPPAGRFFVLFSDEEMQTYTMPQRMDPTRIIYQQDGYTAFGYETYAEFVQDLAE